MSVENQFYLALNRSDIPGVKVFIESGQMDVNFVYPSLGYTPLHYATKNKNLPLMQALLDLGANINAQTHRKSTPLHLAASNADIEAIELLLRAGADYNLRDEDDHTAFQVLKILEHMDLLPKMRQILDEIEAEKARLQPHRPSVFGQVVNFFSELMHARTQSQLEQDSAKELLLPQKKTL